VRNRDKSLVNQGLEEEGARRALEQMVLGVSTRRYARSLEPLPQTVQVRGVSKSAVSERFVYGTERKLAELLSRDLHGPIVFGNRTAPNPQQNGLQLF